MSKNSFVWKNHVFGMPVCIQKLMGFMFSYDFTIQNLTEELDGL